MGQFYVGGPGQFCIGANKKNDAADAEAIVEAALRPTMRFVEPKTGEQQARALVFRTREQVVNQRTEAINALRAHLYEFGYVAPQGIGHLRRLEEVIEDECSELPPLALANKMARGIWAMLTRGENYRAPLIAGAA